MPPLLKSAMASLARLLSRVASGNPSSNSACARSTSKRIRSRERTVGDTLRELLLRAAERLHVLQWDVDAAYRVVARHVLPEVGELERGARRVGEQHVLLGCIAEDVEHHPSNGVGGVVAVVEDVGVGLEPFRPLVDAVRLDQFAERLLRDLRAPDGVLQCNHDGVRGLAGVGEGELRFPFVEQREPVAGRLVAEVVRMAQKA